MLLFQLVHTPGVGLPGPIKIFPFKSLRQLELRGVPIHSLCGLRGIYSQLETLVCNRSIQALEELLSACGGDLCSALPWLALLSADFSYNALSNLDSSLVSVPQGKCLWGGKGGSFGGITSCLTGILVGRTFLCFLFHSPSATPVRSALPQPEPQPYPGLQRLPDGLI